MGERHSDRILHVGRICIKHKLNTDVELIHELCSQFGEVLSVNRAKHRAQTTFVQYPEQANADEAVANLQHRNISAVFAAYKSKPEDLNGKRACAYCDDASLFGCGVCGVVYCSSDCQRLDWPSHRSECIPPPKLVRILRPNVQGENTDNNGSTNSFVRSPRNNSRGNNSRVGDFSQEKSQTRNPSPKGQSCEKGRNSSLENVSKTSENVKPTNNGLEDYGIKGSTNSLVQSPEVKSKAQNKSNDEKTSNGTASLHDSSATKMPLAQLPKTNTLVSITSVDIQRPNYIFIRSLEKQCHEEYVKNLVEISQLYENERHLTAAPNIDDIVLSEYGGLFFRGKVVQVNGKEVLIRYIDYGNLEPVEWKNLKEMTNNRLKYGKCFVHEVMLKDVDVTKNNFKEISIFLNKCIDKDFILTSLNNDVVELQFPTESFQTINTVLQAMDGKDEIKVPVPGEKKITYTDMRNVLLPTGTNVQIAILDTSGLKLEHTVSCVAAGDLAKIETIQKLCKEQGEKDSEAYNVSELEEMCLVFKDDWLRAAFTEESDGKKLYYLCDFGTVEQVEDKNVRKISNLLTSMPVYTTPALVKASGEITDKLIEQIEADKGSIIEVEVFYDEDADCTIKFH